MLGKIMLATIVVMATTTNSCFAQFESVRECVRACDEALTAQDKEIDILKQKSAVYEQQQDNLEKLLSLSEQQRTNIETELREAKGNNWIYGAVGVAAGVLVYGVLAK